MEVDDSVNKKLAEKIKSGEIDPNDKDAIQRFLNEEYKKQLENEQK